jgi:hypothetical protein
MQICPCPPTNPQVSQGPEAMFRVPSHIIASLFDGNGVRPELCVPFDDWTSWFGCRGRDGEDDWTSWLEQHQQAT